MTRLLRLVLLLTTSVAAFALDCNVYSYKFLDHQPGRINRLKEKISRCREVQDCVNEAFYSNKNNLYVINQVFMSTMSRPPVELIVKYDVTIGDNIITSEDRTNNVTSDGYTVEVGWSKTSMHSAIRSTVITSLQPVTHWLILSYAIGEYGSPNMIHFQLHITSTKCHKLVNANVEVREALNYLTTKVSISLDPITLLFMGYIAMLFTPRSLIFNLVGCSLVPRPHPVFQCCTLKKGKFFNVQH